VHKLADKPPLEGRENGRNIEINKVGRKDGPLVKITRTRYLNCLISGEHFVA
jgi:hypothetical protein